jgi:YVTN family beta-propeller protein
MGLKQIQWNGERADLLLDAERPILARPHLTSLDRFPVDNRPNNLAFDGTRLWVVNRLSQTLNTIDVESGEPGATLQIPAVDHVAFDGACIWALSREAVSGQLGAVSKIDITANVVVATVPVGADPTALAFDGSSIWTANRGDHTVSRIDVVADTVTATVDIENRPTAIVFDGQYVWVSGSAGLYKINSAGAVVDTVPVGAGALALAFDGESIWVANFDALALTKLDPSSGAVEASVTTGRCAGLAFDGTYLWASQLFDRAVVTIDVDLNRVVGRTGVGERPLGLAFDGTHIWVAEQDDNTVSRIPALPPYRRRG